MRANKMNTFNIRTIPNKKKYILYIPLEYVSNSDITPDNKFVIKLFNEAKKSLSEYVTENQIVLVIVTDSLTNKDFPVIEPELMYKVKKNFNPIHIFKSSDVLKST